MTLETQQLERTFRYNSVDLIDPGAQYTPEQVRDFYAPTYPEILNAAIEGPEEKDGKLRYTFRRAVGTKGSLLTGHSPSVEKLLRALGAPKHVHAMELKVAAEQLATVACTYYPEEGPFEDAALQLAEFMFVLRDAGAGLVALERHRQVEELGFTAAHDDRHTDGQLAGVARALVGPGLGERPIDAQLKQLTKAGALVAAEIDRLLRLKEKPRG